MQKVVNTLSEKGCPDCTSTGLAGRFDKWKTLARESGLGGMARSLYGAIQRTGRQIAGTDRKIIHRYMTRQQVKKLHLGCGSHMLPGWLNSDLQPQSKSVIALDVTKKIPFKDATFDYVFSEHMIEHLSYEHGHRMLKEAFRVLKAGGKIRVSTPDLRFLIDMYGVGKSELQECYIRWVTERFIRGAPCYADTFVINNFVRDWGHTFIYDEKTLRFSLEGAGFADVVRCDLNDSEDEHLRNLENEQRMPQGFVKLESFTLEATKRREQPSTLGIAGTPASLSGDDRLYGT